MSLSHLTIYPRDDGSGRIAVGNAHEDGKRYGSWFVGHFVESDPTALSKTGHVEVQLRRHPAGSRRHAWSKNRHAHTLVVLIRGRFVVEFPHVEVVLEEEGDYSLWPPGLAHSWRAEEETLVVTVRWPSVPDDAVPVDPPHPLGSEKSTCSRDLRLPSKE
jgi:quercetin dioxygenase-like cupin family protein